MEESMKIVISIALGLLVTLNLIASPAQPEIRYSSWDTFKKCGQLIIPPLFKSSAVATASSIGHELGHVIAAKALLGWNCIGFNIDFRSFPFHVGAGVGFKVTESDLVGPGVAGMLVAGPLTGTATNLSILVASNIATEYKKSNSIKNALIEGIKKPLLNTEQSKTLQCAVALNIISNINNLIPHTENVDGNRLIKALGFASPFARYPNAIKNIHAAFDTLGLMYLGLKIYNVHTGSNLSLKEAAYNTATKTIEVAKDFCEAMKD